MARTQRICAANGAIYVLDGRDLRIKIDGSSTVLALCPAVPSSNEIAIAAEDHAIASGDPKLLRILLEWIGEHLCSDAILRPPYSELAEKYQQEGES